MVTFSSFTPTTMSGDNVIECICRDCQIYHTHKFEQMDFGCVPLKLVIEFECFLNIAWIFYTSAILKFRDIPVH